MIKKISKPTIWKRNPALWLIVIIFTAGLLATTQLVYRLLDEKFIDDRYFGYSQQQLEDNFEDLYLKFEDFDEKNFSISYAEQLPVGDNRWHVSLTDADQQLVPGAKLSLFIKNPTKADSTEKVYFQLADDKSSYISDAFHLEAKNLWVFQLMIEYQDALRFEEIFFLYDKSKDLFVVQSQYWKNKHLKWPELAR
ncbi:MAG: hypothetical protein JJV97_03470 [SAR324 cluster bacterium]|nr:hypothetical protein [SAR324 cluster bacterium]